MKTNKLLILLMALLVVVSQVHLAIKYYYMQEKLTEIKDLHEADMEQVYKVMQFLLGISEAKRTRHK